MLLILPCFLSSFYNFLFFFLSILFTLSFLLLSRHRLFPLFDLSFSWVLLSGYLLFSYHEFPSLKCFPPLGLSFSAMVTSSFYSKLIQWDFSLLPLGLHQLFFGLLWTFLQDYPPTHWLLGHYLCSKYVSYTITHFMTKFSFICSCCIPLPLGD